MLKIVFSSFQMNLFTPPVYFIRWFPKSETDARQGVFLLAIFWQRDKETKSAELERNRSTYVPVTLSPRVNNPTQGKGGLTISYTRETAKKFWSISAIQGETKLK